MKELLFLVKNEDVMIKGRYDIETEKLSFKALNEEDIYYSLNEIEQIEEGFINMYEEDIEALNFLIQSIKCDDTLIPRIKQKEGMKLMFIYEMEA